MHSAIQTFRFQVVAGVVFSCHRFSYCRREFFLGGREGTRNREMNNEKRGRNNCTKDCFVRQRRIDRSVLAVILEFLDIFLVGHNSLDGWRIDSTFVVFSSWGSGTIASTVARFVMLLFIVFATFFLYMFAL